MDLYGTKNNSILKKTIIIIIELILITISYIIMFRGNLFNSDRAVFDSSINTYKKIIIFTFSIIVFLRTSFMMIFLLKRKLPWEEVISVPMAFALYYIGFPLLINKTQVNISLVDYIGIGLFLIGSFLNTFSELQRHFWKAKPENKGKIYSKGLFSWSMHINYFGDFLWVIAYAVITWNIFSISIPIFLFCFFVFYNIPKLDNYLLGKYKDSFTEYSKKTKRFIPFVL